MTYSRKPTLIACCGNRLRGDDALGLRVFDALTRRRALAAAGRPRLSLGLAAGIHLRALDDGGFALLDAFDGYAEIVIVDALHMPGTVGDLVLLDASRHPLPSALRSASTHALGVAGAVELGRALGRLPDRVIVLGVIGQRFEVGAPMGAAVKAAIPRVMARLQAELVATACGACTPGNGPSPA